MLIDRRFPEKEIEFLFTEVIPRNGEYLHVRKNGFPPWYKVDYVIYSWMIAEVSPAIEIHVTPCLPSWENV